MSQATHFVFSPSAAPDLRRALQAAGRQEAVIAFFDNLSFGPIAPPSPELRGAWVEENLGVSGWDEVAQASEKFWSDLSSVQGQRAIWVSRRSAHEYAGFLEALGRLGELPCHVIDLTDRQIGTIGRHNQEIAPHHITSTGLLTSEDIIRNGLLDLAQSLTPEQRHNYLTHWRGLQSENAPFRIVDAVGLHSAPITCFDDMLVSCARPEWQKMARVVGEALWQATELPYRQVGDIVLAARLFSLSEAGRLQARGGLATIHDTEICLPN
ncbi:MAG TPA: DUF3658 domain-containing protein [Rhizomicrobium sp.]|nr:DUF3658 domain-containing protein [Rhizomicrobium sp.]